MGAPLTSAAKQRAEGCEASLQPTSVAARLLLGGAFGPCIIMSAWLAEWAAVLLPPLVLMALAARSALHFSSARVSPLARARVLRIAELLHQSKALSQVADFVKVSRLRRAATALQRNADAEQQVPADVARREGLVALCLNSVIWAGAAMASVCIWAAWPGPVALVPPVLLWPAGSMIAWPTGVVGGISVPALALGSAALGVPVGSVVGRHAGLALAAWQGQLERSLLGGDAGIEAMLEAEASAPRVGARRRRVAPPEPDT